MFRNFSLFILVTLFLLTPVALSHAQVPAGGTYETTVSVDATPKNPGPLEAVSLSIKSYTIDLQSATIEWRIDGKKSALGIGLDHFTFTTKDIGSPTTITAYIIPVGTVPITKVITITPMTVDVLWQSTDSIVPPFYKGKAMPSSESDIKFVAIPQVKDSKGNLVPSGNFIYNWQEDYSPAQLSSGYATDYFSTSFSYLNPTKHVDVTVTTPDVSITAKGSTSVTPVLATILWYASSPLYGPIFDTALTGTFPVVGNDTSIIAEPYFFSKKSSTSSPLKYTWELNGEPLATPSLPNVISLHRDTDETGAASLYVKIISPSRLFQEAESQLELSLQ